MFLIFFSELQEEAQMDKNHRKIGNEVNTGSLILIYTTSCRKFRSMKRGGDIPTGGVTLFPIMSKGDKEKYHERKIKSMKIGGATQMGDTICH
jgi:hypothetical protein